MNDFNIRNLACAIIMQAVKDFVNGTEKQRKAILKDLRSAYMDLISNGTSVVVADQLELCPEEIAARLRQYHEIGGDQT